MVCLRQCQFSAMSLLCHRTRLKSRYIISILVGLSIGFALSLACLVFMSVCDTQLSLFSEPFLSSFDFHRENESWSLRDRFDPFRYLQRSARSAPDMTLVDYASQDYEPQIHSPQELIRMNPTNSNSSSGSTPKPESIRVQRPRYIADELGIREKVLVAILTDVNHLNTLSLFHNQTLQDHVNRILFFIDEDTQNFPNGMQVVSIHDKRAYLRPFYVLKYLAEKMIKSYDWFFLVPDNTYIRGYKVVHQDDGCRSFSTNLFCFLSSIYHFS
jgi:hypothetical protein